MAQGKEFRRFRIAGGLAPSIYEYLAFEQLIASAQIDRQFFIIG